MNPCSVKRDVLVTGAAGFVGRHVIFELLHQQIDAKIFAVDILPPETIARTFNYSPNVFPISFDLCRVVENSNERSVFENLLHSVKTIFHIAGCVDTRETAHIRKKLDLINRKVTEVLGRLADKSQSRFVFVSSAAAGMPRESQYVSNDFSRHFLHNSLLSSMHLSSYGMSKLQAEEALLGLTSLHLVILRPHVVWGKGDPLSTDMLLQWPSFLPHVLFGDGDALITEIRVDILAKYIILADEALQRNTSVVSHRIFHIGTSSTTLRAHQQRISQYVQRFFQSVVFINGMYALILVFLCEVFDRYRVKLPLLHLITANNLAYCSRGILDTTCMETHREDCDTLLSYAGISRKIWLKGLRSDGETFALSPTLQHTPPSPPTPTKLGQSWALGPLQMKNHVIKAATFECMASPTGVPTGELIAFHRRVAAGGAAMTIVAYASVSPDGRSFASQICLRSQNSVVRDATLSQLQRLCSAVHEEGGLAALQITHAGAFADPSVTHSFPLGPTAIFNPLTLRLSKPLTVTDEKRILNDFVASVDLCREAGFDAIELHLGHGYLLSQYLSRRTNPVSPEKRLRFPLSVVEAVCCEAHRSDKKKLAVFVKFNVSEACEQDLPQNDIRAFAAAFVAAGADMLVPSGGHVMTNGLHMLRGGRPLQQMALAQRNTVKQCVIRWLGWLFVAKEPYRDTFFREKTLSVMLGAGIPLHKICLIGGVHDANTAERAICDGFGAVQLGRVLLADPDWCHKIGITDKKLRRRDIRVCDNSNECIIGATMAQTPLRCMKYINDW